MADPTRDAAFALIAAVLDRGRSLDDALEALPPMEARDRAAAHRLAAAVLRRLGTLDAVLEPFLSRAPPVPARHVLRIGAAGLLLLNTPPHAAVATAVALARSQGLAPFAKLVNAVLRRVASAGPMALEGLDGPRLDTPAWLWASWGEEARAIATAHQHEAPLDMTLTPAGAPGASPDAAHPDQGAILPNGTLRLPAGTRVADVPVFAAGTAWVQDMAAGLPARLLAARPGEQVADLCAAPGGKTAQLAASGARVVAVERDQSRLGRLRVNLARLRLSAELVQADAATWQPEQTFDAVLLDAPCSATGTIRRHPDVPYLKRPRDIPALTSVQDRLITAAARLLRPGGRLIYAVCSLQPEEEAPRLAAALAAGLRHAPFAPEELSFLPEARTREGNLRTHPGLWADRGGMDGFFAARLMRP